MMAHGTESNRGRPATAFQSKFKSISAAIAIAVAVAGGSAVPAMASEIKYVVNNRAVTSYDIQRRAAFLKLQRRSPETAKDDMIEQALRSGELQRLNIRVSKDAVNESYKRFAAGNKLTTQQLDEILAKSGVTADHFREYIGIQMGWNQALGVRLRSDGQLSEQDAVQRMLKDGGAKPKATEYLLQQVIFVVPSAERASSMARRKKEADAMRLRFTGCQTTRDFAKGLVDVTVRDLGRVLEPELPPDWEKQIKEISVGKATSVRETDRGVEFIGICSAREVSDDRVARTVFQNEGPSEEKADEINKKYMAELKKKARIVER